LVLQPGAVDPDPGPHGLRLHCVRGLGHVGQVLPGEIHVAVIEQDHVARHRIISSRRPRSQERPHLDLPVAGLRPLGGELERHVEVGGLDDPEAGEILLRLQERPVGEHRLLASVVDDGGRAGRREAAGEDPVTLRHEPVVEHVDGRILVRSSEAIVVRDHGNEVLHLGTSPVVRGRPRGRPLTPATNTPAPIRHRLPDVFRGLLVRQLSTYKRVSMRNDARRAGAVRRPFGMKPETDPQPAAAKDWAQALSATTTEAASTASLLAVPGKCRSWLTPVSTLSPGPVVPAPLSALASGLIVLTGMFASAVPSVTRTRVPAAT